MENFEAGPRVCKVAFPESGLPEVLVRAQAGSIDPVDVAMTVGALEEMYECALLVSA